MPKPLFISSTAVYNLLEPGRLHRETDPIGGTSGGGHPPTYAVVKMSAEGAVRALSHALRVPATIARLTMQYGGTGGRAEWRGGAPAWYYKAIRNGRPVPVRTQGDDYCSLHHIDDIVRQVPLLWDVASIPATVVNWGGEEAVSLRGMAEHIGSLIGVPATFVETEAAFGMVPVGLVVGSTGYLLAGWLRTRAVTGLLIALVLGSFVVTLLAPLLHWPPALRQLSIFEQYGAPLIDGLKRNSVLVQLAVATFALAAAVLRFERKDLIR